jgi:hypothetical protein
MESEILGSRSGGCGRHCIIHSGSGILPVIAGIVLHALLGPSGIARKEGRMDGNNCMLCYYRFRSVNGWMAFSLRQRRKEVLSGIYFVLCACEMSFSEFYVMA